MEKNPFLDRLMKEKSEDVVHSSAYAEAQNAEGIGTASVQSFAARQAIEANRTAVKGYKDSRVVNDAFGATGTKLKGYDAVHDASQRAAIRERFGGERNTRAADKGLGGRSSGDNKGSSLAMSSGRDVTPPARRNPGISR